MRLPLPRSKSRSRWTTFELFQELNQKNLSAKFCHRSLTRCRFMLLMSPGKVGQGDPHLNYSSCVVDLRSQWELNKFTILWCFDNECAVCSLWRQSSKISSINHWPLIWQMWPDPKCDPRQDFTVTSLLYQFHEDLMNGCKLYHFIKLTVNKLAAAYYTCAVIDPETQK